MKNLDLGGLSWIICVGLKAVTCMIDHKRRAEHKFTRTEMILCGDRGKV